MQRRAIFSSAGKTFFVAATAVLLLTPQVWADIEGQNTGRSASVIGMHGQVEVRRGGDTTWVPAYKNMIIYETDSLRTGNGSSADIKITGGEMSEVRVMESSELMFDQMMLDPASGLTDTLLYLSIGKILVTAEDLTPGSDYNVQTPTSLVGIRGTMFEVTVT